MFRFTKGIAYLAYLKIIILFGCSATLPQIRVNGKLAGQEIQTTVDSEIARYYLENYLQNKRDNSELDSIIGQLNQIPDSLLLSRSRLKDLSGKYSVDFATLLLANRILTDNSNRRLQTAFYEELSQTKLAVENIGNIPKPQIDSSYMILFVPGWFYKSHPETGADFAEPRKIISKIGIENYLVEVDETGSIEQNAARVADAIIHHSQMNNKIILVSASKSGPEVSQAIGELLDSNQTRNVKAWLNIVGVMQGSPLADSALRWPKSWFARLYFLLRGWDFASVVSMATAHSRDRFSRLNIPAHIQVIDYIGIPLSGDITNRGWDSYLDLRSEGPNDGLVLIPDEIAPHSIIIADMGLDHYIRDPGIDLKTVALAQTIMKYIETDQMNFVNLLNEGEHND